MRGSFAFGLFRFKGIKLAAPVCGALLFLFLAKSVTAQAPPALTAVSGGEIPTSRGGSAASFTIKSSILKETRKVLIVLPSSFSRSAPDRKYPVIFVTDGEALVPVVAAASEELTRNGQIPESVIVGVENVGGADEMAAINKRVNDLTPPGLSVSGSSLNEGGDRFLDFIERELFPAVDRQFRTSAPRIFVGHSSGGVLATYAAATRSTYCAIVSLDAPIHLGDDWLAKKLIARTSTGKAPVRYASLEAVYGWPESEWKALTSSAPSSWRLVREKLGAEGHESMPMIGAYIGLRQVFSDYSLLAAPKAPTTSILPYYASVSASLGAAVVPPKKLLQNVIDDLLIEGRGAVARDAYTTLAAAYGTPANSVKLLSRISDVEKRPPPTETVEGLLSTPFPAPAEIQEFVGEWVGDVWMNADEPHRGNQTLIIKVVDGKVTGETIQRMPNGEQLVQKLQYLKKTEVGLTWGNMNGMRPRAVLLLEGTLKGDTLSGKLRFGGVNFTLSDGSTPPELHFSFKRVK